MCHSSPFVGQSPFRSNDRFTEFTVRISRRQLVAFFRRIQRRALAVGSRIPDVHKRSARQRYSSRQLGVKFGRISHGLG